MVIFLFSHAFFIRGLLQFSVLNNFLFFQNIFSAEIILSEIILFIFVSGVSQQTKKFGLLIRGLLGVRFISDNRTFLANRKTFVRILEIVSVVSIVFIVSLTLTLKGTWETPTCLSGLLRHMRDTIVFCPDYWDSFRVILTVFRAFFLIELFLIFFF